MPGIIDMTFWIGPSLPIWPSCFLKSSRVNSPLRSLASALAISSWSNFCWACSTSESDVAHAQDAAGQAIGMELLQGVEVLARADELDRHAGHGLDRQGGAAAGVAVELGHDHAVEFQGLVERLGAADGVLAGHRVDHQEDLVGTDAAVDLGQLAHQLFVDVQAAGRIEDHHLHAAWPWPA